MITGIVNAISNPKFQSTITNTIPQVSIETGLKAVGRPLFTLVDKNADKETRKYSAAKELLYQILCLGIYLAIIPPVFKKGGFKLVKKFCEKANGAEEFLVKLSSKQGKTPIKNCKVSDFKSEKGVLEIHKLGEMTKAERGLAENKELVDKVYKNIKKSLVDKSKYDDIIQNIEKTEKDGEFFRQFYMAKGGIDISSIIGSVIGLTVLAPQISHIILHPIMQVCGLEAPRKDVQPKEDTSKLDAKV